MLDDQFNLVSFGSLDNLLAELAAASKAERPKQPRVETEKTARVGEDMLIVCSGLPLSSILFLRCLVRSITDNVPLASIASGFHFFLNRMNDEELRQTVIKDWVLSATSDSLVASLAVIQADEVMKILTTPCEIDFFCFFRFELALAVAVICKRSISTADACYALISNLPESEKIGRAIRVHSWESMRSSGFPVWVQSHEELKKQCAALLRQATADLNACPPEDAHAVRALTQQTMFWAVVGGCSPRTIAAWKWRENERIFNLLSSDWTAKETREAALRAAVAHKAKSEFLFAAAILIWLGDLSGACRDCIVRGLGDWQLCLFIADLLPGDEQQRKVYAQLWDEFVIHRKDPWLGFALAKRMTLRGMEAPVTASRMLQTWMDPGVFGGVDLDRTLPGRAVGLVSSQTCPGLQELELVLAKFENR